MTERQKLIVHRIIQIIQSLGEYVLISVILIFILIAIYALWDIKFVASKAQPGNYAIYKPGEDKKSFEELIVLNPDVIGWLDIYGTNIDYPVVQAKDNEKYLMMDAEGRYSLSGSLFLDYRNRRDFSDFNSIIHGHSMSHNAMFGDVSDFLDEEFFKSHPHGDLYFNDAHHGLKILGIAEVDAYTSQLYRVVLGRDEDKSMFFREVSGSSKYEIPESELKPEYTYVLLSTCTSAFTNGRHILICRLTDETYDNPYASQVIRTRDTVDGPRLRIRLFLILLLIIIILIIIAKTMSNYDRRKREEEIDAALKAELAEAEFAAEAEQRKQE